MRTRSIVFALTLAAAVALSACGSDSGGDESATALSQSRLDDVLIGLDELGDGYRVDDSEDDEDSEGFGCLKNIDDIDAGDETEPVRESEARFEADDDVALPGVLVASASLPSVAAAKEGLAEMRKVLAGCTSIEETDEDGSVVTLTISHDDDTSGPGLDDQLNFAARGTLEQAGAKVPMSFHFAVMRIEHHVVLTAFVTLAEDASADAEELAEAARAKFTAIVAGDPAPEQTVDIDPVDLTLFEQGGSA